MVYFALGHFFTFKDMLQRIIVCYPYRPVQLAGVPIAIEESIWPKAANSPLPYFQVFSAQERPQYSATS